MSKRASISPTTAAFALAPGMLAEIFPAASLARLRNLSALRPGVIPGATWKRHVRALRDTEILFTAWGAPVLDEEFLSAAPRLRAVFHAANSLRVLVTPAVWRRGVRVFSSRSIHAASVADYAASVIGLALKHHWRHARMIRETRSFPAVRPLRAAHQAVVGLVGYGTVARAVGERLRPQGVAVVACDPFVDPREAEAARVRLVPLPALFETADVVSLHAGLHPGSYGLVGADLLSRLKPDAALINTACGELIDEAALADVWRARPDLQAVLDVTAPSPPLKNSPLYDLPNVVLTPHLSSSLGRDCGRLGEAMVDEFARFQAGRPTRWEITSRHLTPAE